MSEQQTEAWYRARMGQLGASRVADAIAKTKSGWGASRANLMAELIAMRLTGVVPESFTSVSMQWGNDTEPQARSAYEFRTDASVELASFIPHHTIEWTGATPDGCVGADGLVEIKCPNTATHLDTLLGDTIPGKYIIQMQWQMACTNRAWCDFVSFDPRLPEAMRLFIQRIPRDDVRIDELEKLVSEFLKELNQKLTDLTTKYPIHKDIAA